MEKEERNIKNKQTNKQNKTKNYRWLKKLANKNKEQKTNKLDVWWGEWTNKQK